MRVHIYFEHKIYYVFTATTSLKDGDHLETIYSSKNIIYIIFRFLQLI